MLPCAAYLRIYEPLSAFAADERARWSNYAASSDRPRRADRKSTRLNSSHLVISYAVFCLKKKNKCAEGQYTGGRSRLHLLSYVSSQSGRVVLDGAFTLRGAESVTARIGLCDKCSSTALAA